MKNIHLLFNALDEIKIVFLLADKKL